MASGIPHSPHRGSRSFQKVVDAFLGGDGLPFAQILSAERIDAVFAQYGCQFGTHGVYTTPLVVWSFLSQVLHDGKEASCQSAVARIVSHCEQTGMAVPTQDTGDYCRARAKLSEGALRELTCELAEELEQAADESWLWKGKLHPKLIDGFTFTMPDTLKNQARYPQPESQKPGVGFPIARAVAIISLATACVMDMGMAPYTGKETGEPALLRSMLARLAAGDIAVFDRCYCSFMMISLLLMQGTQTCARKHQLRHSDFRRGRRLGKYDHIIVWTRPDRPAWMDEETSHRDAGTPRDPLQRCRAWSADQKDRHHHNTRRRRSVLQRRHRGAVWLPLELGVGYSKYQGLPEPGARSLQVARDGSSRSLGNHSGIQFDSDYGSRRDFVQQHPRQISFTSTCQYVLASWMQLSAGLIDETLLEDYLLIMLKQIAACEVANRPGRLEPRVLKRRRHGYPLMRRSRPELRAELRQQCT
jgi:hypothetical protein